MSNDYLAEFLPAVLLVAYLATGFVFAAIGHAGVDHPFLAIALSAGLPPLLWLSVQPYFRARRLAPVDERACGHERRA